MKKIVLILLLAFFAGEYTYAQFALGAKLGYNASKLTTDIDTIKTQFNSGFHIGIWSRFGKRLYIAPELQYTFSGGVFTQAGNVNLNGWKQKVKVGSVDIPVLVGFKIIHSDFITWRLELGPQVSFIVNKKIEDENSVTGPIKEANFNTANWYILGGTGVDFLFLKFDVRYQYGLNDIIKNVQTTSGTTINASNQMWVISLGFKIFGSK